jgi:hypothetical protein
MKTTLEQIDELRKRANVGYKEAKEALDKFDGDLVDALAYLDGENKINNCCHGNIHNHADLWQKCKSIISKGNKMKLKISKNDNTILNLPLTLVILVGLLMTPLFIGSFILALFTGCRIRFSKENGEDCCINKHLEKAEIIINATTEKVTEDIKNA